MRILFIHNHYRSGQPSGENQVYALERALLESRGHRVAEFERHSDDLTNQGMLGVMRGAVATPWNPFSARRLRALLADFQPDIVHAHNTFPLISPAIFATAKGFPRVFTLHNYRLFCAAGVVSRNGTVCTLCLDRQSAYPALRYGCYRNSRVATLPLFGNITLHHWLGTWRNQVESFIVLSEFQKRVMTAAGLPAERLHVKPNFFPGSPIVVPWEDRRQRVVFVGRLSEEKGVADLIDAWQRWGMDAPELLVVGDGPLRGRLEYLARSTRVSSIRFIGQISFEATLRLIGESRLMVLPSRWFEVFGMVLIEAFAHGTPAVVSNLGSLPDLVSEGNGAVFQPGDSLDLLRCVQDLWQDEDRLERMGVAARRMFEKRFTEEANYSRLMEIYTLAITLARNAENRNI